MKSSRKPVAAIHNVRVPDAVTHGYEEPLAKVSIGARLLDAILCVVFLVLAVRYGGWYYWLSAALCACTATFMRLDKLGNYVFAKFFGIKNKKTR